MDAVFQMTHHDAVVELRRRVRNYSSELDTLPPLAQVQDAATVFRTANELSSVVGMTAELAEVISNAAILLGWLNYNMHNRGYANAFWKMALDRAVAGGNRQVHAYVLGIMSCLYSGVPKRGGDRYDTSTPIAMLDQALLISKDTDNHPLRAYLCGRRAEEHAVSGHSKAAFQDLMVGHAILGRALDRNDCAVPILDEWQDARLARYHGSAAQILGDHREARRALRVALETLRPSFLPQRAMIMSDLASVFAQQENPDPESAAGLLCDALDIAQPAGLGEAEMRVVEARRHLDRWSHLPAVKHLDERLRLV